MSDEISWDEATKIGGYVSLDENVEKKLKITNWRLEKRPTEARFAAGKIEFIADVIEEDGKPVSETKLTTTSNRLKKKLRIVLEDKPTTNIIDISIMKVGDRFDTQYGVKLIE